MDQYPFLVLGARCLVYRGVVPLNATVVQLLLVHANLSLVAREIDFQSGGRVGILHLRWVHLWYCFSLGVTWRFKFICVVAYEFKYLLEKGANWAAGRVRYHELQVCQVR